MGWEVRAPRELGSAMGGKPTFPDGSKVTETNGTPGSVGPGRLEVPGRSWVTRGKGAGAEGDAAEKG